MVGTQNGLFCLTKSNRGWHPCSYEAIVHLKKVKNAILRKRIIFRRIQRIMAKSPPNRDQAAFKRLFLDFDTRFFSHSMKPMTWEEAIGSTFNTELRFPMAEFGGVSVDLIAYLETQIKFAMMPMKDPDCVAPIQLPENWRKIVRSL